VLTSFKIRHFRTFRELKIDRLAQVNLVVGQNNVGKTTLLEALWLYANGGRSDAIYKLLVSREELFGDDDVDSREIEVDLASLFHGRVLTVDQDVTISLGEAIAPFHKVQIGFALVEQILSSEPAPVAYQEIDVGKARSAEGEVFQAIVISAGHQRSLIVRRGRTWARALRRLRTVSADTGVPFIHAIGADEDTVMRWWDSVALQEAEIRVISCLNLVCPVERVTAVGKPRGYGRVFKVKLQGQSEPQPLKSLGDGVVRIFQTALALEYSRRETLDVQLGLFDERRLSGDAGLGLLLIDEVESGIHYSALAEYWRLLFRMAHDRGVQIVATTHSWDCIEALQQATREEPNADVQLIRLETVGSQSKAVLFSRDELAIVAREQIEVR
jgi:hypothetical protein